MSALLGEIGFGGGTAEKDGGVIVGAGGGVGRVEGAKPDPHTARRVTDLGRVLPPRALADASVVWLGGCFWVLGFEREVFAGFSGLGSRHDGKRAEDVRQRMKKKEPKMKLREIESKAKYDLEETDRAMEGERGREGEKEKERQR